MSNNDNRPGLPSGVRICGECGEARSRELGAVDELTGESYRVASTCLCEGRPCAICGELRLRKIGSDYWDLPSRQWRHVPMAMGAQRICRECAKRTGRPITG